MHLTLRVDYGPIGLPERSALTSQFISALENKGLKVLPLTELEHDVSAPWTLQIPLGLSVTYPPLVSSLEQALLDLNAPRNLWSVLERAKLPRPEAMRTGPLGAALSKTALQLRSPAMGSPETSKDKSPALWFIGDTDYTWAAIGSRLLGGWYQDQVNADGEDRVKSAMSNLHRVLQPQGTVTREVDVGDLFDRRFGRERIDESTYLDLWLREEGEALLERCLGEQQLKSAGGVSV